jgi:hypothetical protein
VAPTATVRQINPVWQPALVSVWENLEMATDGKNDPELAARLAQESWPTPPDLRPHLIKVALGIAGLETQEDGQVTKIQGKGRVNHRNKLAAMRILASFDRNALEQQRVELAMEAQDIEETVPVVDVLPPLTPEIFDQAMIMIEEETKKKQAAQALEPEPDWREPIAPEPEEEERRWPITPPMRKAILASALDLCGLEVTPEKGVASTGQAPRKARIVLGALRVLAMFDLLAIQQKRVKYLGATLKLRQKRRHKVVMDQEIARKVNAFIHDERVKLRDRIEGGDLEALAQANAAAAYQRKQARWRWN